MSIIKYMGDDPKAKYRFEKSEENDKLALYELSYMNAYRDKDSNTKAYKGSELIFRINDCSDNKTFDITFTFNKDQAGRWLATADSLAKLNDLYSFMDKKFEFGPDTTDLFDRTSWLFAEDGKYQNTTSIELDIWFTDNPEKNFYYVVSKDNVEVYKSEPKANEDIF